MKWDIDKLEKSLNHSSDELKKEEKSKNIKLDWNFISEKGFGGIEPQPDTFNLAMSNMLISTGKIIKNIKLSDSIRNTIDGKYDIVLANPPMGIKGLQYDDIDCKNKREYKVERDDLNKYVVYENDNKLYNIFRSIIDNKETFTIRGMDFDKYATISENSAISKNSKKYTYKINNPNFNNQEVLGYSVFQLIQEINMDLLD